MDGSLGKHRVVLCSKLVEQFKSQTANIGHLPSSDLRRGGVLEATD